MNVLKKMLLSAINGKSCKNVTQTLLISGVLELEVIMNKEWMKRSLDMAKEALSNKTSNAEKLYKSYNGIMPKPAFAPPQKLERHQKRYMSIDLVIKCNAFMREFLPKGPNNNNKAGNHEW